jgi:hypothetical protein
MSVLTFYFSYDTANPIGSLAVENGELVADGCGEEVAYNVLVLDGDQKVLGPADGNAWLQGIANRMQSYIVADYETDGPSARHYPGKHNQDDHGNWAREKGALLQNEENIHDALLNGRLTVVGPIESMLSGRNEAATAKGLVELPNGRHMKVFIKTKSLLNDVTNPDPTKTRVHIAVPMGTDLEREMACQIANEMLGGIARTEPCVIRDVPGRGESLVQRWAPGTNGFDVLDERTGQPSSWNNEYAPISWEEWSNLALFDGVVGNADTHPGNMTVDKQGHVYGIDHGYTFPEQWLGEQPINGSSYKFAGHKRMRLSDAHIAALKAFKEQMPKRRAELERWVGKDAVDECVRRVNKMLASGMLLSQLDMEWRMWRSQGVDV